MKKNKGFTLIELLAVIIILGLISVVSVVAITKIVKNARNQEIKQQKKVVELATESYLQYNKGKIPKKAGTANAVKIYLSELKTKKFLEDDVKNPNGESCMTESYVTVTKVNENDNQYTYVATLICGGQTI